jgi:G3E family GTPase
MRRQPSAIPLNVITGFLGSGKTTLLQRLLLSRAFADTAVLVNEFGEVGLDHHLLRRIDDDVVLLQSGCLCCTIRGDLSLAIRDLYARRESGELPRFRRLVIETTGLADPVPVLATIMSEPVIRHHFRLGNVITTVDAVNGGLHLDCQPESLKQIAVADRIVLTKCDIAEPEKSRSLVARLGRINPSAPIVESANSLPDAALLLGHDIYDQAAKSEEVRRWLAAEQQLALSHDAVPRAGHRHNVNRHDDRISAFCLTYERAIDWTAFGVWLSMLLHAHGDDILRVKGILNVAGASTPVVVHGVQHLVHPPSHLAAWPDADRRSRIVFITRDIPRAEIERSLDTFNRLSNPPDAVVATPRPSPRNRRARARVPS